MIRGRLRRPLLRGGTTRQRLLRHLTAVVVLGAVGAGALLLSYGVVHSVPARVQSGSAPAVQEVVAARVALNAANRAVSDTNEAGLTEVVGPGELYTIQIAAADQSLSQIADRPLTGGTGRRTLEIVIPLLGIYNDDIGEAVWRYNGPDDALMREEKLKEADSVLQRPRTGVVPRLNALQRQQIREVREQTDVSAAQLAGWAVAEAALLGLFAVLVSALVVLWRRCGRLFNVWLTAALLLTLALAVIPALLTEATLDQLDIAYAELKGIAYEDRARRIETGSAEVQAALADTASRTRALPFLAAGCALAPVCAAGGLLWRLYVDYRSDKL